MRTNTKPIALIMMAFLLVSMVLMPAGTSLANISDGTYKVNYQILKADNDSVSMANDYFEKPAILTVEQGKKYIQLTINHSSWIKTFTDGNGGPVQVMSENKSADTRVVKFPVNDLSKPVPMKMHVLIETMDPVYDHEYTVRYDFDIENMKPVNGSGQEKTESGAKTNKGSSEVTGKNGANENKAPEENPKTSDNAPIAFYLLLFTVALLFFLRKKQLKGSE